jgi:ubiquitin-large subunit ribosomal protein L40e
MEIDSTPQVQDNVNAGTPAPVITTPSGPTQVFVKTLTGQSIAIDYRADLTIAELKNEVSSREGVPVQQQRLIFQGKQLENDSTLEDYNIQPPNTIHLVLHVKGGQ